MTISWIDILLVAILLVSALLGVRRGMSRSIFGVVYVVIAFYFCKEYGGVIAREISSVLGSSVFVTTLGYALVFVLIWLLLLGLANMLRKNTRQSRHTFLDISGGLAFGSLRGAVLGMLLVAGLASLPLQASAAWRNSVLVSTYGSAIKAAIIYSGRQDYANHWRFNRRNQPRLALAVAPPEAENREEPAPVPDPLRKKAQKLLLETEEKVGQRDRVLDAVNEEFDRQALHQTAQNQRAAAEKIKNRVKRKNGSNAELLEQYESVVGSILKEFDEQDCTDGVGARC